MKTTYILQEVHIRSENREKDSLTFTIREGDILLDKGFRREVLPAARDFQKTITRRKVSKTPFKHSDRLLRIKELGEDSAVVAILDQETDFENADTLVIKERESLKTVKYGEEFTVYAKEQVYDAICPITYTFLIIDASQPKEQKVQNFCTECGEKLIKGDKFCRECGTHVLP